MLRILKPCTVVITVAALNSLMVDVTVGAVAVTRTVAVAFGVKGPRAALKTSAL